jgi:hypothetical protein
MERLGIDILVLDPIMITSAIVPAASQLGIHTCKYVYISAMTLESIIEQYRHSLRSIE